MPRMSVRPRGKRIHELRSKMRIDQRQLAARARVNPRTITRVENNEATSLGTLEDLADVLGVRLEELIGDVEQVDAEWDFAGKRQVGKREVAPNGIQYDVFQIRSLLVRDRLGRGKRYDVSRLSDDTCENVREALIRHATVCNKVQASVHIPSTLSIGRDISGQAWWVVDKWIEGDTLGKLLKQDRLWIPVPKLMQEILLGLQALHEARIIRRALSPESIVVEKGTGRVVLTDFEVAKLLQEVPTVRPAGWPPDDPYLVDEVGRQNWEIRQAADVYSWGVILVEVLRGRLPKKREDWPGVLEKANILDAVRKIAQKCLSRDWRKRPQTVDEIVWAIKRWS